jgi:saccharopepsin
MKYTSAVAAATLLGSASAGVHKMKLKKVPLSEQLVSPDFIVDILAL